MMERKYLICAGVRQPPLDLRGGLIHCLETFAGGGVCLPGNLLLSPILVRASRNQKGISNNEEMSANTKYRRKWKKK
jgi:hypothetical protein